MAERKTICVPGCDNCTRYSKSYQNSNHLNILELNEYEILEAFELLKIKMKYYSPFELTYYPITGKSKGILLSKNWFHEDQLITIVPGGIYLLSAPIMTAPGFNPLANRIQEDDNSILSAEDLSTKLFCKSHSVWYPNRPDENIKERTWMDFWDQDYEDKLIKKIEQGLEKWESEFWEFAIDIKDEKHGQL